MVRKIELSKSTETLCRLIAQVTDIPLYLVLSQTGDTGREILYTIHELIGGKSSTLGRSLCIETEQELLENGNLQGITTKPNSKILGIREERNITVTSGWDFEDIDFLLSLSLHYNRQHQKMILKEITHSYLNSKVRDLEIDAHAKLYGNIEHVTEGNPPQDIIKVSTPYSSFPNFPIVHFLDPVSHAIPETCLRFAVADPKEAVHFLSTYSGIPLMQHPENEYRIGSIYGNEPRNVVFCFMDKSNTS